MGHRPPRPVSRRSPPALLRAGELQHAQMVEENCDDARRGLTGAPRTPPTRPCVERLPSEACDPEEIEEARVPKSKTRDPETQAVQNDGPKVWSAPPHLAGPSRRPCGEESPNEARRRVGRRDRVQPACPETSVARGRRHGRPAVRATAPSGRRPSAHIVPLHRRATTSPLVRTTGQRGRRSAEILYLMGISRYSTNPARTRLHVAMTAGSRAEVFSDARACGTRGGGRQGVRGRRERKPRRSADGEESRRGAIAAVDRGRETLNHAL